MKAKRVFRWVLPLLSIGVLLLFLVMIWYPVQGGRKQPPLEISVIARESDGSAWDNARRGMEQAASDLNVELRFLYPGTPNDSEEQEQLLLREIEGGAGAVLLLPADREALSGAVREAGVQAVIVTLETEMDGCGYIGVDNRSLGEALGRAVCNGVREGGTALLLDSAPGSNGIAQRLEAARALLESEGRHVAICRAEEGQTLSAALTQALEDRRVLGVAAFEASALELAAQASREAEDYLLLYGVGSTAAIIAALEQGDITSVQAQNEFSTGYLAVERAARLARREQVGAAEELSFFTVRRENMYDPDLQKLLFPVTR